MFVIQNVELIAQALDHNITIMSRGEQGVPALAFFTFGHLPEGPRAVSAPFAALAIALVTSLAESSQRDVALQRLLEAKDAAVRAHMADAYTRALAIASRTEGG